MELLASELFVSVVLVSEGAEHVTISGVAATKMWGDVFYIQGANDVKLCSVTADNNRRQGLSIIQVNRLEIKNSTFKNTDGTPLSMPIFKTCSISRPRPGASRSTQSEQSDLTHGEPTSVGPR